MTKIDDVIAELVQDAKPIKPLRAPKYWILGMLAILLLYGISVQLIFGVRPDVMQQFTRFFFSAELLSLGLLALTSCAAAIASMYPDAYQRPHLLRLPYGVFLLLLLGLGGQFFLPTTSMMLHPKAGAHTIECTQYIAVVAMIPAAVIFALLRKGASIRPLRAGTFAVFAASSVGLFTLRLSEANDSISHLLLWHYLPTVFFASLGALGGKWLLRW